MPACCDRHPGPCKSNGKQPATIDGRDLRLADRAAAGSNSRHTDFQSENKPKERKGKRGSAATRQQIGSAPAEISQDLQALIDAWPALPDALKAGILAMVKAAGTAGTKPDCQGELHPG
jgi:hypothetical protein